MESTLQWRDNKIKALEAQRDYFMKKASEQISLSRAQVLIGLVELCEFSKLKNVTETEQILIWTIFVQLELVQLQRASPILKNQQFLVLCTVVAVSSVILNYIKLEWYAALGVCFELSQLEINWIFQDGGLIAGDEEQVDSQQLLDEVEKLRNELIQEQQKKSVLNDEDLQLKEKLYQETKSRANKAEQEVESQKVWTNIFSWQIKKLKIFRHT